MSEDHKGDKFLSMFTILSILKEGKKPTNYQLFFSNRSRHRAGPESIEISGNISKGFGLGLPSGIFSSRQYKHVTLSQVSGLEVFSAKENRPLIPDSHSDGVLKIVLKKSFSSLG